MARDPIQLYRHRPARIGGTLAYLRRGIVQWGDSITGDVYFGGTGKLMHDAGSPLGIRYRACAIGGENSTEIRGRLIGIGVISPTASPAAGPYRVYAQERLFGREYAGGYEGLRFLYRQTIARPHTVQWFNGATLLGTTYATDRVECVGTANTSTDRIESAGHGLLEGHRIHIFTTGEVPGGLGNHEQYFVRNPTTNAFQLSVSPTGTVIDLTTTGGTLQITGPYFIDITAPGGALNLSVRTLTDCSDLTTVFFLGTNDVGTAFASVMSNLNDMIGRLEHDRYIVVTPLNNESTRADATGADLTNYLGYQALLTSMRSTFGTRLVDIYQMFMDAYIPGTDSASENAAGLWPDRFRADTIHPNATGESMVRDAIIAKLTERGWWNTSA